MGSTTLRREERALLVEFDALAAATRKGILLGDPDAAGGKWLTQVKDLMGRMLGEIEAQRAQAKPRPPKAGLRVVGGTKKMGQRKRKKQAQLFFDKLMSTGGRTKFFKEEPIQIKPSGSSATRDRTLAEWRAPALVLERIERVLKYSALPSVSRHHWGTDIDVGSVEPDDWKDGARLGPMRVWLESNRDVLPLKTTYSGERDGGYHDESWHLTMGTLGAGLHERFNEQIDIETDVIPSILEAYDAWSKGKRVAEIPATREALKAALANLDLSKYVDGVHPDVKPGAPE